MVYVMQNMLLRNHRRAFKGWADFCEVVAARHHRMRGVLRNISAKGQAMRKALNSWTSWSQQISAMQGAIARIKRQREYSALNAWAASTSQHAGRMTMLRRSVASLRNTSFRAGFNSWTAHVRDALNAKRRMRSACAAFSGSGVRRAWMSWTLVTMIFRRMSKVVQDITQGRSRRALASWVSFSEAKAQERYRMQGIVRGISAKGQSIRKAINTWVCLASARSEASRVIAAIRLRGERLAFTTWAFNGVRYADQMALLRRSLSALRNVALRSGLNGWLSHASEAAAAKRRMISAYASLSGKGTRKAWLTWVANDHVKSILYRAIASFRNNALRSSLNTWVSFATGSIEIMAIIQAAILALRHRNFRACLLRWMEAATACSSTLELLLRSVKALRNRALKRGFLCWVATSSGLKRRLFTLRRALSAMCHRGLHAALNSWIDTLHLKTIKLATLRRAVAAMRHRSLHTALFTWASFTLSIGQKRDRLRLSLLALKESGSRKAWNTWLAMLLDRQWVRNVVSRIFLRSSRRGFDTWLSYCDAIGEKRRRLRGILHGSSGNGRGLRRAYNTWADLRDKGADMRSAAAAIVHRGERRALNQWHILSSSRAQRKAVRERMLRKAIAAFQNGGLRSALNKWEAQMQRAPAELFRRACSGLLRRSIRCSFQQWLLVRRALRAERVFRKLVKQRTITLQAQLDAQQPELQKLRRGLVVAQRAAAEAADHASLSKRAAEKEIEQQRASSQQSVTEMAEQVQLTTEVAEARMAEEWRRLQLEREDLEAQRVEMQVEMQSELDAALEQQRAMVEHQTKHAADEAKKAWLEENHERERERESTINQLRLKLGLSQTSVCRLLVDKADVADHQLSIRMAAPTRALQSLVARARTDGARVNAPPARATGHAPGTPRARMPL